MPERPEIRPVTRLRAQANGRREAAGALEVFYVDLDAIEGPRIKYWPRVTRRAW